MHADQFLSNRHVYYNHHISIKCTNNLNDLQKNLDIYYIENTQHPLS